MLKQPYFCAIVSIKRCSMIRHKNLSFCMLIVSRKKDMCSDLPNISLEVGFGVEPIYKLKFARVFLRRNSKVITVACHWFQHLYIIITVFIGLYMTYSTIVWSMVLKWIVSHFLMYLMKMKISLAKTHLASWVW